MRKTIKDLMLSLAIAGIELTLFEKIALAVTVDQNELNSFIESENAFQSNLSQQLIVNYHTNTTEHTDESHIIRDPDPEGDLLRGDIVHTNTFSHTNSGFDHLNYVPAKPAVFNMPANKRLFGTVQIAVYSYDKNRFGAGTQDNASKTILYDISIRRIKNLDGTANVSPWRTLASDAVCAADGSFMISLNTIDPFGVGNSNPNLTEGYYEIQVIAKNVLSYNGNSVVQASQVQTVPVLIKQNQSPTVTVTNGSEFVNFTFSFDGILSPTGVYSKYAGHYAGADASQQEGLLVRVTMRDPDSQATTEKQWQKGRVILKSPSGATVATTPIVWTDTGNEITSSENTDKAGLAFIPKDNFLVQDMKNAVVVIEVTDYTDAACTQPTGTVVQQTTVSATDLTPLYINVDINKPTVNASTTDYTWKNTDINVQLTYTDLISGIKTKEYKVTTTTDRPTDGWLPYVDLISITTDGQYYIHWHAKDGFDNEQFGYFGPYCLDKTPPTATHQQIDLDDSRIRLDVTAFDNLSGVKRIKLPNGAYVSGNRASYTVPAVETSYNFIVEDNAGNTLNYVATVNLNPVVKNVSLVNIVNPPKDTSLPINLPVGTPVAIKAGYQMTFDIQTVNTDELQIRILTGDGTPLLLNTNNGTAFVLTKLTGSRTTVHTIIAFWLDPSVPKNTVITIEIKAIRYGTPNRETLDTTVGRNFATIVGSSLEDAAVNQIK